MKHLRAVRLLLASAAVLWLSQAEHGVVGGQTPYSDARDSLDHEVDQIFGQRATATGDMDGGRGKLLRIASQIEELAAEAPDSVSRFRDLLQAAGIYYVAAVPDKQTAVDDPLRLFPGEGWSDYLRLSWQLVDELPEGVNRREAAWLLAPALVLDNQGERGQRIEPLYGAEYVAPALELLRRSSNPVVQTEASAFVVRLSVRCDWGLACRIAAAAYEIEKHALPETREEADALSTAVAGMYASFRDALGRIDWDVMRAIAAYREAHGEYPPEEGLRDAERLWVLLRPHLPAVIRSSEHRPENPEWMDLEPNPFVTVPGLRISSVSWSDGVAGERRPSLDLRPMYWEGMEPGSRTYSPWSERCHERVKAIEARGEAPPMSE